MKYFTIEELCNTSKKLTNAPDSTQLSNLEQLVIHILDVVREALNKPVRVTSGFRSKQVNEAVGGSATSQHTTGEAADLQCDNNKQLFDYIKDNLIFDQLIWEFGTDKQPDWVHVSYSSKKNRKQVLRAKKINGKTQYINYI